MMSNPAKANKLVSMQEATATYVSDNSSVAIEGFTGFICFAAGHEIIRQRRRNLTLIRMTPDLIYDQMIAAGTANKLIFSYMGNPGVGSLYCIRRAVEKAIPCPLESIRTTAWLGVTRRARPDCPSLLYGAISAPTCSRRIH
jgi:acyl CoA:acetate/3-ketoacid CoA transferase alpha subunit